MPFRGAPNGKALQVQGFRERQMCRQDSSTPQSFMYGYTGTFNTGEESFFSPRDSTLTGAAASLPFTWSGSDRHLCEGLQNDKLCSSAAGPV